MIVSSQERRMELVTGWAREMDLMKVMRMDWDWDWVSWTGLDLDLVRKKRRVMAKGVE